jgi:tetratricopeptide (TPR) repeat protein
VIAGHDSDLAGPLTTGPAICLNMIVKNVAPSIEKVLNSVAPYISSWVIVDAGSDDGTQELVKSHMAGLGIPGELYERSWRSFGDHRSKSLTLAQGHGDYIWVLDSDDVLVGRPDFTQLSAGISWLRCIDDNGDTFWRAQLFPDGLNVHYEGVADECTARDDDSRIGVRLAGDYHIESRYPDTLKLSPQNRFARERDLLLVEVERNPEDSGSVFSLGHCYFELGDFASAHKWYARRVEMGGWDQEVFFAMYRIAESMAQLGEPWPDVQEAYLEAWEFRPTRAEPLYAIAFRYRLEQHYELGHLFAQHAAQIPLPETDTLFVYTHIYTWCITDEQAICASQTGKHHEAFTLCRRLVASPDLPDRERPRITANRDISVPAMLESASSYPETLVRDLIAGPPDAEVTVTLIAGPDRIATELTLNSFLHCCTDLARVGRFVMFDTDLPTQDREILQQRYPFLEFAEPTNDLRSHLRGRFWLHLGQGWRFFAPDNLITRLTAVLDAEPHVVQVAINYTDATTLTGTCAPEDSIRRTAAAGRYLLTNAIANGPAMTDTTRLNHTATTEPHTATLDEILCTRST